MKADELISTWKAYDKKLDTALLLQDKIVETIIKERVSNRFARLRWKYAGGITWMLIWLAFSIAVLFTNPFDYGTVWQYLPMGILAICLAVLSGKLIYTFFALDDIAITHLPVDESLKRAIALYERPKRFFGYTIIAMLFTQTVLFPLSFLPHKLGRSTPVEAILDTIIPMLISAALLFIAHKAGAFKERDQQRFRQDLDELQDFQKIASHS